ncbi:hypothetical protein K3495_g4995 [Podosphaera aphanis]|nr:hypothetical protein K3495_g4995 [Podosphaera aphanis]
MRLHQPQGPSKLEPKIQGEENYIFIGMQGNNMYKLMHQHLFKGVDPEKPHSNSEIYKNTHLAQTPLQIQTKKRKAIEAVITDKNNSKLQCKPSTEAMSKPSTEAINTPRAHQHDALTQLTVRPKAYYAEYTKLVYGHNILKLAQSLSAVSIESGESQNTILDTYTPLSKNIDVIDALKGDDAELLVQSLRDELQALKDTKTYEIYKNQLPVGKKLISSKWVCRYQWNPDDTVSRRKSRLVARGFEQSYGSEYFETFATVVRYSTLRTLLAKAATEDLEVDHIDANTAFLNPTIKQEIYIKISHLFDLTHPETKGHEHEHEYYLKLN